MTVALDSRPTGADLTVAAGGLSHMWDAAGLARRGRQGACPSPTHAQSGTTPPVSIDDARGLWHCHGCGAGGSGVDFLVAARGMTLAEAMADLRRRAGMPALARVVPLRPRRVEPGLTHAPQVARRPPESSARRAMARYLGRRGWGPEAETVWGLEVVVDRSGRLRVRHPYRVRGEVRWWQDRAVDAPTRPKWLSPEGQRRIPYALDLYGTLSLPAPSGHERPLVALVEGPADTITLSEVLGPEWAVVGLPGTQGLDRWSRLWQGRDLVIVMDADAAGDSASARLVGDALGSGDRAVRVRPPEGLDVGEWRAADGDAAVRSAVLDAAGRLR